MRRDRRGAARAALAFALGYTAVRMYWATGGRWGYTACDQRHETPDMATGCGAAGLATLPFQAGWGAVLLGTVLIGVAAVAVLATPPPSPGAPGNGCALRGGAVDGGAVDEGAVDEGAVDEGAVDGGAVDGGAVDGGAVDGGAAPRAAIRGKAPRAAAPVATWLACAGLVLASFPMHLLFQIPAGLAGHVTDWRDVANRLVLLGGSVLFGRAAAVARPSRDAAPPAPVDRPVPGWLRRWAYACALIPLVGWTLPHGMWLLDVPFGIEPAELDRVRADITPAIGLAIVLGPALGGLLAVGLVRPWGRVFPRRVPLLGGRRVPRPLALVPTGTVAASMLGYGVLSSWFLVRSVLDGTTTWAGLRAAWAVAVTVPVFLAWGAALAVTAYGYHLLTRPDPLPTGAPAVDRARRV